MTRPPNAIPEFWFWRVGDGKFSGNYKFGESTGDFIPIPNAEALAASFGENEVTLNSPQNESSSPFIKIQPDEYTPNSIAGVMVVPLALVGLSGQLSDFGKVISSYMTVLDEESVVLVPLIGCKIPGHRFSPTTVAKDPNTSRGFDCKTTSQDGEMFSWTIYLTEPQRVTWGMRPEGKPWMDSVKTLKWGKRGEGLQIYGFAERYENNDESRIRTDYPGWYGFRLKPSGSEWKGLFSTFTDQRSPDKAGSRKVSCLPFP